MLKLLQPLRRWKWLDVLLTRAEVYGALLEQWGIRPSFRTIVEFDNLLRRPAPMAKPDWLRPLPKPIEVGRRKVRTLADVRAYILKLPARQQAMPG